MNMKAFLAAVAFIMIFPLNSMAQNQKISISLTHPIPVGSSLYSEFDGVISSSFKYSRLMGPNLYINGQFDFSNYERVYNSPFSDNKYLEMYKFILSSEVAQNIGSLFIIKPEWGMGYTFLDFRSENSAFNKTKYGFTTRFALHIDRNVFKNFSIGATSSFDMMFLNKSEASEDGSYKTFSRSVNIGIVGTLNF